MSKKVKTFAIVILIIAALIWAMSFFGNQDSSTPNNELNSSTSNSPAAGVPLNTNSVPAGNGEFSDILSSISTITIDTSIFNNPSYKSLRDFPVTLGSDIKGRPNPFAPVGNDQGTIGGINVQSNNGSVQFETLQPNKVTATTAEFGAQAMVSSTIGAKVVFEYGINDLLGNASAPVALASNGTALTRVTGLSPDTTYYVRAVLTQGSNVVPGEKMTFTTLKSSR